jgi:hypothetical protein
MQSRSDRIVPAGGLFPVVRIMAPDRTRRVAMPLRDAALPALALENIGKLNTWRCIETQECRRAEARRKCAAVRSILEQRTSSKRDAAPAHDSLEHGLDIDFFGT